MSRRAAPPVLEAEVPQRYWDLPELTPAPGEGKRKRPKIEPATRERVYKRDNYRCVICGAESPLTIDHRIPLAKGGKNCYDNMQTMCFPCNNAKGDEKPVPKPRLRPKRRPRSRLPWAYEVLLGPEWRGLVQEAALEARQVSSRPSFRGSSSPRQLPLAS